ncbi:protein MMS22-like [Hyalella azteca]|uniref:Protein MMS22-like n=1 Tax=Hyalella azteca TaxID=294128 RepID=A0A979FVG4_HYAAZ|nr:protein MMS22-like [Hyalella azteca]
MPSPDWEDWLTEDALDIDFLEQVEAQHLTSSNKNEAGNAATRGLVTFECSGAALLNQKVGVEGSIVQSGALSAVIHGQSLCTWKELCSSSNAVTQDVPVVFQLPCSPDMLLFNRDHFINGVRQSINVLEQQCNKVSTLGLPQLGSTMWTTAEQLRQQVVMLYNCLWCFLDDNIKTSLNDSNQVACKSVCADVIGDILDLLNYIGPLSELNQHVTSAVSPLGNQCPSAAYHLFHLHLDIRWWSLAIIYMLETRLGSLPVPPSHPYCSGPPLLREPLTVMASSNTAHEAQSMMASGLSDSDGHFTQCVVFILWDLMTLMARQVSKASLSMPAEDGRQGAGLPCSCSHEVALTVLLLSQQHHQDLGTSSFWDLLRPRLLFLSRQVQDSVLNLGAQSSSLPQLPPAELKGIHPALPFEILLTFAKCLCFNEHGHAIPSKDPRMVTGAQLLMELLNHLLTERPTRHQLSSSSSGNSSGGSASVAAGSSTTAPVKSSLPEESMRRVMRCCVHLTSMWVAEPRCLQVAMLVWEKYFARNLDSSFLLTGANSMHGLACVSSQAREWVVAARQRSSDPTQLSSNESSWNIFLRIVGEC